MKKSKGQTATAERVDYEEVDYVDLCCLICKHLDPGNRFGRTAKIPGVTEAAQCIGVCRATLQSIVGGIPPVRKPVKALIVAAARRLKLF